MQLAKNRHVVKLRALTPERARLSPAIAVTAPELVALVVGAWAVVLAWSRHYATLERCTGNQLSGEVDAGRERPLVPLKPFPVTARTIFAAI